MTVAEMIRFTAAFLPRWRADLGSGISGLRAAADRKVKALSRGMRTSSPCCSRSAGARICLV